MGRLHPPTPRLHPLHTNHATDHRCPVHKPPGVRCCATNPRVQTRPGCTHQTTSTPHTPHPTPRPQPIVAVAAAAAQAAGQHRAAIASLGRVLELQPGNARALLRRGLSRHRLRDYGGAADDLQVGIVLGEVGGSGIMAMAVGGLGAEGQAGILGWPEIFAFPGFFTVKGFNGGTWGCGLGGRGLGSLQVGLQGRCCLGGHGGSWIWLLRTRSSAMSVPCLGSHPSIPPPCCPCPVQRAVALDPGDELLRVDPKELRECV